MDIKKIEEKRQLMLNELPGLKNQLNQIQIRIQELSGGIKLCNELIDEEKAKKENGK